MTIRRRVDRLYSAFNRRDVAEVFELMSPTVQWANAWQGGYVSGRVNVADYWSRQWSQNNSTLTPKKISTAPDGRVMVDVVQVVCDSTGTLRASVRVTHLFTFGGTLVSRMDIGDSGFEPIDDEAP